MDEARFLRVSRELSAVVFSAVCINVLQSGVGPVVQTDAFANKVQTRGALGWATRNMVQEPGFTIAPELPVLKKNF